MPVIRLPNVMSFYTEKQSEFSVSALTAIEAVRAAVEKYPLLRMHVLDKKKQPAWAYSAICEQCQHSRFGWLEVRMT